VTVSQVMAVNGATTLRTLAGVETSATQVVIPSGILTAGNTYVFDIQSRSGANLDLAATPNALSLPDARASVTTAMATP
jgi:hypothetical protein